MKPRSPSVAVDWSRAETPEAAAVLAAAGIPERLSRLLARRGVREAAAAQEFLEPQVESLHDPFLLDGMESAVERLLRAATDSETVVIVGDYDVDGISATALLVAVFGACGIQAEPILPHRIRDGYGFQPRQVEIARERGAKMIVTADCGSHSHEAVQLALDEGIDVIITDHHLPGEEHPEAVVHLNPHRPGSGYPFRDLSGAGLAFKLAAALVERAGKAVAPEILLRVACLGTIADMVPLRGENRTIAALGLAALPETRSVGLRALMGVSRVSGEVRASDIGFRLGPRINAAGRMDSADVALRLLLTRDPDEADEIARRLDAWNGERQRAEAEVVDEAIAHFEAMDPLPPILVAWRPNWHRGVVGIAAGRLSRRFNRPTILLSVEDDMATGSGRSIEAVHLHDFLLPWKDRLERFGGHSQAIGMTASLDALDQLQREWIDTAESWDPEVLARRYRYEERLTGAEVNDQLLAENRQLEPFGIGNPRPVYRVGPLVREGALRQFGKNHLSCTAVDANGDLVRLLGWRWAERRADLEQTFEVLGTVKRDRYTRKAVVELIDARPANPAE